MDWRHVGRSVGALRAELDHDPRLRRLSSFPPGTLGEAAVQEALGRSAGRITAWLKNPEGPRDLEVMHTPALPAGIVVGRDGPPVAGARVLVVLRRDDSQPGGRRVLTAYPLPARPKITGLEALASFFAACFHQDWLLAGEPAVDVVTRHARAVRPSVVDAIVADIDRLLLAHKDLVELRARLDDLDLEYDPTADDVPLRSWLFSVRERFSEIITPPSRGASFTPRV